MFSGLQLKGSDQLPFLIKVATQIFPRGNTAEEEIGCTCRLGTEGDYTALGAGSK